MCTDHSERKTFSVDVKYTFKHTTIKYVKYDFLLKKKYIYIMP